jgi:dTDP-4-dehydrorhamnose reductase
MKKVLVTGGKGQLGRSIKDHVEPLKKHSFVFVDYDELNIVNSVEVTSFFGKEKFDYCINCAAYTAVDKAEAEESLAEDINVNGAINLAKACQINHTTLIHISTDFVFDGNGSSAYTEEDIPNPLGVYGLSKARGENAIVSELKEYFIIRTAWLYSAYGNNFVKTMLKLGSERQELRVVNDQFGTPTFAGDLARVIIKIITEDFRNYGIYHFSNQGEASWYDFAKEIFKIAEININLIPVTTKEYPTPAKRPTNSILDKTKIVESLDLQIPDWRESLSMFLKPYLKTHH